MLDLKTMKKILEYTNEYVFSETYGIGTNEVFPRWLSNHFDYSCFLQKAIEAVNQVLSLDKENVKFNIIQFPGEVMVTKELNHSPIESDQFAFEEFGVIESKEKALLWVLERV